MITSPLSAKIFNPFLFYKRRITVVDLVMRMSNLSSEALKPKHLILAILFIAFSNMLETVYNR